MNKNNQTTPATQLMCLINGACNGTTTQSIEEEQNIKQEDKNKPPSKKRIIPPGFAHNSEAFKTAKQFDIPLIELQITTKEKEKNLDLFAELETNSYIPRYMIAEELWQFLPVPIAGPEPEDSYHYNKNQGFDENESLGKALAWDKEHILFHCPRNAVCTITRKEWSEGRRLCRMC